MQPNQFPKGGNRRRTGGEPNDGSLAEGGSFPHQSRHDVGCVQSQFLHGLEAKGGNLGSRNGTSFGASRRWIVCAHVLGIQSKVGGLRCRFKEIDLKCTRKR